MDPPRPSPRRWLRSKVASARGLLWLSPPGWQAGGCQQRGFRHVALTIALITFRKDPTQVHRRLPPRRTAHIAPSTSRGPAPAMQTHLFTPWLNPPGYSSKQKTMLRNASQYSTHCRGRTVANECHGLDQTQANRRVPKCRKAGGCGCRCGQLGCISPTANICQCSECRTPAGRVALLCVATGLPPRNRVGRGGIAP